MKANEIKRLRELEENARLKKIVAEQAMDISILKEVSRKKLLSPTRRRKAVAYRVRMCISDMNEKRNSEESKSARLEGLYRKASDPVLRTHLLMVWRLSLGDSLGKVARTVGYSQKWTR